MSTISANNITNNQTTPTDLTIGTLTNNKLVLVTNSLPALSVDLNQSVTFPGSGFVQFPAGTTAQRPAVPAAGMFRFNTTLGLNEEYNGTTWVPAGSSPVMAGTSGTIDGTTIGGTTPAAGSFTNLNATGNTVLGDAASDTTTFTGNQALIPNGLAFVGTGAITLPNGTTAQEPATPTAGMMRFNTTTSSFEGFNGVQWGSIGNGLTPFPIYASANAPTGFMYLCDSTSAPFTLTLPPAPVNGQMIGFTDRGRQWGTNPVTLVNNGNLIVGSATTLVLNNTGATVILAFDGTLNDWAIWLLARP